MAINYNLDNTVLTSKYVISDKSTIVYVAHHDDETWEFWGKETIDESEIVVVSLRNIVEIDSTVLEIVDLPQGFNAIRTSALDKWEIVPKN